MALENILDEIEIQRKTRLENVHKEYDRKTGEFLISTEKHLNSLIDQHEKQIEMEIADLKLRSSTMLDIEIKKILNDRSESLLSAGMKMLEKAASEFTQSNDYQKALAAMIAIARKELGDSCTIYLDKNDMLKSKDSKGLKQMERKLRFKGGIFAVSKDGKKELDLTIDTIFRESMEHLLSELFSRIGGK